MLIDHDVTVSVNLSSTLFCCIHVISLTIFIELPSAMEYRNHSIDTKFLRFAILMNIIVQSFNLRVLFGAMLSAKEHLQEDYISYNWLGPHNFQLLYTSYCALSQEICRMKKLFFFPRNV